MMALFELAQVLIRLLHPMVAPLVVPFCFVASWALIMVAVWSVWSATQSSVAMAKRMHQIPCVECRFYTGDYRLKCPVNPTIALSEQAISCPDYESSSHG